MKENSYESKQMNTTRNNDIETVLKVYRTL